VSECPELARADIGRLKALFAISKDVVAEISAGDDLSRKIYASYEQFRTSVMDWSVIAERAFLNSRRLA
jgi:TRAP-type mannitol/chloroaromatic compound transport system substrate-binding protein